MIGRNMTRNLLDALADTDTPVLLRMGPDKQGRREDDEREDVESKWVKPSILVISLGKRLAG